MSAVSVSVGLTGGRLFTNSLANPGRPGGRLTEMTDGESSGWLRRRLDRLRKAGMLQPTPSVTIEQAVTSDELWQAYSLVHEVFVSQGYILPQEGSVRLRAYEALPETATFVAKAEGRIVAVMGVVPDTSELGLPSDQAFHPELEVLRSAGRRIAEVTNLAVAPDYRNTSVFYELSRCCIAHGINQGFDDSFISISPGHAVFFQAVLGFEPWGDRRNYGGQVQDPVEGMRLNVGGMESRLIAADRVLGDDAFLHDWFFRSNPHFQYTKASAAIAKQKFLDPALLRSLFGERTGFLRKCSPRVLDVLAQRWGKKSFALVAAGLALDANEERQCAA